jgi:hypothetical protein
MISAFGDYKLDKGNTILFETEANRSKYTEAAAAITDAQARVDNLAKKSANEAKSKLQAIGGN